MLSQSVSRASQLAKPNLLLIFDAFGTLFSPKDTVAQQYVQVARQCGLAGFSEGELAPKLYAAFKEESRQNPNYGKATGLGATKWWTNIINRTFIPFLPKDKSLPPALVPRLIERFASNEAYDAEANIVKSLRKLRQSRQKYSKIVIGVLTNSDDRVPGILSSFGFKVSPLRYGTPMEEMEPAAQYDIDFHCMSYDVGVEKPDKEIFKSAEVMLSRVIAVREGKAPTEAELGGWRKIYVGDEYAKDVEGARNAGWEAVLLDTKDAYDGIKRLEGFRGKGIGDVFDEESVVRVRSIAELTSWFADQSSDVE